MLDETNATPASKPTRRRRTPSPKNTAQSMSEKPQSKMSPADPSRKSLEWLISTAFWGLLQIFAILVICLLIRAQVSNIMQECIIQPLFMDSVLLFFSSALVASIKMDYKLYKDLILSKSTNIKKQDDTVFRESNTIIFEDLPNIIIGLSALIYGVCFMEKIGNKPNVDILVLIVFQLLIVMASMYYAFYYKRILFQAEQK